MRRLPLILLLLALLLPLAACGKKGPVRPLLQPLPAAPAAFEARQLGDAFLLGWTIPAANQDGSPLTDLAGFRIYRLSYLLKEDCPECREITDLWQEVDLEYPREARILGNRVFLWDQDVAADYGYRYQVVPVTGRGRFGAPVVTGRPFVPPPPPPQELIAVPHDRMVRLSWLPPEGLPEEESRYYVYRRTEGDPSPILPLNDIPLDVHEYEDFAVENGRTYTYVVRTVAEALGAAAESIPSQPAVAIPRAGL